MFSITFAGYTKTLRVTPEMEAKQIDKPMLIEAIVNIAYEIEVANKRLERMNRTK